MTRIGILVLLLSASVLSGCTVRLRPYEEPTSGPTATVFFYNQAKQTGSAAFYADAKDCSNRFIAGSVAPGEAIQRKVPADKELAFSFGYGDARSLCSILASFTPNPNAMYHARLRQVTEDRCELLLTTGMVGAERNVPAIKREPRVGFDETSSFCRPIADKSS